MGNLSFNIVKFVVLHADEMDSGCSVLDCCFVQFFMVNFGACR